MPPVTDQFWLDLVSDLGADKRRLCLGCPVLLATRTNPDALVDIVAGRTSVDPLGFEGGIAHWMLSRCMRRDHSIAMRAFEDERLWRTLIGRCTGLAFVALREQHIFQQHYITGQLRPMLEVLERGFYLPDPIVPPPAVRPQLVDLSTALLDTLPILYRIGDNKYGAEAVGVNLSLAMLCQMWCGSDHTARIDFSRTALSVIDVVRRFSTLAMRENDWRLTSALHCLQRCMERMRDRGDFTADAGFVALDRQGHVELIRRIVTCATRPYDRQRPESKSQNPATIALILLINLCRSSPFIVDLVVEVGAHEPLARCLVDHVWRGEDAVGDDRFSMRMVIEHGVGFVFFHLLNRPDTFRARTRNWQTTGNEYELYATWTSVLFNDNPCVCGKQLLATALHAIAKRLERNKLRDDGIAATFSSALALAIPKAIRSLVTADPVAAADVERRRLLGAWLALAPLVDLSSAFCIGCGQSLSRHRCNGCAAPICSRACQRKSWPAHRPYCKPDYVYPGLPARYDNCAVCREGGGGTTVDVLPSRADRARD